MIVNYNFGCLNQSPSKVLAIIAPSIDFLHLLYVVILKFSYMIILCNVCFTYIVTSALLSCNKQDSSLYTTILSIPFYT